MNVLLVFPPLFASLVQPHAAVPRLAAVLRRAGHRVEVCDLNLAFVRRLVEGDGWPEIQAILDREWDRLEGLDLLDAPSQRAYLDLAWTAGRPVDDVGQELRAAAATLRDTESGYIWEEYDGATRVMSRMWALVARALAIGEEPCGPPGSYYGRAATMSSSEMLRRLSRGTGDPCVRFCAGEIINRVRRQGIELVGISITTLSQLEPALGLARMLNSELGRRVRVVLGGNIVTRLRDVFVRRPDLLQGLHAAVVYEGELPLLRLAAGEDRSLVPNLIYVTEEGGRQSPVGDPMPIDDIPTPDFSGLDLTAYLAPEPVLPIVAGHGCDWKRCGFCNIFLGYSSTQHRDPELVATDMVELHRRHGARLFTLYQESISPERLAAISQALLRTGVDLRWEASSEFEPGFTADDCATMYRAGCRCMHLGLETVDDRVIGLMQRNISAGLADEVVRNTAGAGIMNAITVISGFPTETLDEARRTGEFIQERARFMQSVSVSVYYISRGSPVDRDPGRYDVILERDPDLDLQLAFSDYECASGMTPAQRHAHARELMSAMREKGCVFPVDPPLLFLARYETDKPAVVFERSREFARRPRPTEPARPSGSLRGPRLNRGVLLRRAAFPLDRMRSTFVHPLAAAGILDPHPIERDPADFCLDSARDRVLRLSPQALALLRLCDGRNEAEVFQGFLEATGLESQKGLPLFRGLLRLHQAFLDT